jgi:hypothetical protein
MAAEIIILSVTQTESELQVSCLFWFAITSGVRTQTAGSAWVASGSSAGASAAQNSAIQAGTILEESHNFTFPIGTSQATVENYLQQAWTNRNGQINGVGPNLYYGAYWNGSAWATQ